MCIIIIFFFSLLLSLLLYLFRHDTKTQIFQTLDVTYSKYLDHSWELFSFISFLSHMYANRQIRLRLMVLQL